MIFGYWVCKHLSFCTNTISYGSTKSARSPRCPEEGIQTEGSNALSHEQSTEEILIFMVRTKPNRRSAQSHQGPTRGLNFGGNHDMVRESRSTEHANGYYKDNPHVSRRKTGKYL